MAVRVHRRKHHPPYPNFIPTTMLYLEVVPDVVPRGVVLVHNHVTPHTRQFGVGGFRAWFELANPKELEVCPCDWAPELGKHYRVRDRYRRG
jgi:hypothetical protein